MSTNLEAFLLYYDAWHNHEFGFSEMKELVVAEIGADGLRAALTEFMAIIQPFRDAGDRRTYHLIQKDGHGSL